MIRFSPGTIRLLQEEGQYQEIQSALMQVLNAQAQPHLTMVTRVVIEMRQEKEVMMNVTLQEIEQSTKSFMKKIQMKERLILMTPIKLMYLMKYLMST